MDAPVMYDEDDVERALEFLDYCIMKADRLPAVRSGSIDLESVSHGLHDLKNIFDQIKE